MSSAEQIFTNRSDCLGFTLLSQKNSFFPVSSREVTQQIPETHGNGRGSFHSLFNSVSMPMLLLTPSWELHAVNPAAAEMLGKHCAGMEWRAHGFRCNRPAPAMEDLSSRAHRAGCAMCHIISDTLETGRRHEEELMVALDPESDGKEVAVHISTARIILPDTGNLVLICLKDISREGALRKELDQRLREIQDLQERLHAETDYLNPEIDYSQSHGSIITQSHAMNDVLRSVHQVAPTESIVLIQGETGTGKELVAKAIHSASKRRERPWVKVDCTSLPSLLVESELFGHEKGAYTSASTRQVGRFEIANGGTLFLDEIGELPMEAQAKLLRVLQEGEFERLGSPRPIRVDVRVIAATNRSLVDEVRNGRFREDLFYRLNVFPVTLPPLRERIEDISLLVWAFIAEFNMKMGKNIQTVSRKSMNHLQQYHWPGNIRQLRNTIEQAFIRSTGSNLEVLPPTAQTQESSNSLNFEENERQLILQVLRKTNGCIKGAGGAAQLLGLKPSTLYSKMKRLSIHSPNRRY